MVVYSAMNAKIEGKGWIGEDNVGSQAKID